MNDYYDPSLKQSRLDILCEYENFVFRKVDLKDKAAVDSIFEKIPADTCCTFGCSGRGEVFY